MPEPTDRKAIILDQHWGKFPYDGKRELTWDICEIETQADLENLRVPQHGAWLEQHDLGCGSNRLADLARTALEVGFFANPANRDTGQWKNYQSWKEGQLLGRLECSEMPALLDEGSHVNIFDGWGRLLPYLVLIYEAKPFYPFEAYLIRGQHGQ